MVLAAMANPPEHDFAPSWLKVPADQQKRGQKLGGSSDQWAGHQQDSEGANKSRHRHYSSTDSSGTPSSYGRPQTAGHPGSYANRGRETDRRHYPRPGSGSRHHSVDDLNGYHDYSSWSLPQYNGYYPSPSNYPRRGGSVGPRDGPYSSSHYGDVFHPSNSGRGQYNNVGGRGRQRYNSGSRADKDNHQDTGSSSTMGVDSNIKKKDGKEEQSKSSALFSNDFPSLIGDNSKTSTKAAAKTGNTPAGVWGKTPGAAKVQISGRKVQLIKKVIHNDLPPRDPNLTSRDPNTSFTKSSKIASSTTDTEQLKFGSHGGSESRDNRTASSGSTAPSSGGNSLLKTSPVPQKTSTNDKVKDTSPTTPSKDSNPSPNSPRDPQPTNYTHNKQNDNKTVDDYCTPKETSRFVSAKNSVNKPTQEGAFSTTTKDISKAGPGTQFVDIGAKVASKPVSMTTSQPISVPRNYKPVSASTTTQKSVTKPAIGKESPTKPVLVQTTKPVLVQTTKPVLDQTPKPVLVQTPKPVLVQTPKPVLVQTTKPVLVKATTTTPNTKPTIKSMSVKNSGKESPTKPILVQTSSTKPTIKSMSSKDSPIRSVPIQIKSSNSAKFSGKDAPIRQFPMRLSNSKQGGRVVVRPGPVQIRSNRLVGKETPAVRPVPVQALNRKHVKDDSISNVKSGSQPPVSSYSSSAKEPSSDPRAPPMDITTSTFSLNKNVNNSDRLKGALTGMQNGGDHWSVNGLLRIEDAGRMNGPQHSTSTTEVNTLTGDIKQHNGLDNDLHSGRNHLELSSSLEAEKKLLQEMGWHEHSDNEEVYAPITEDEMKEFQRRSQQLKRNGVTRSLPVTSLSSSLPSTQLPSIDLDDALSSCSSDSSDDDL